MMALAVTDFPLPLSPTTAIISPGAIVRSTPDTTVEV